ncbi:hypothetical protein NBRC116584_15840 [Hydrogenophaga sp. 5NK40-0174]
METTSPTNAEDIESLDHWRRHWSSASAIMMVSPAAVRWFFGGSSDVTPLVTDERQVDSQTRWWSPGPGTAKVLTRLLAERGLDARCVDSPPNDAQQFDSEALWAVVSAQVKRGSHILVVRGRSRLQAEVPADASANPGGDGRQWLLDQCRSLGAKVSTCVAYERRPADWSAEQLSLAAASDHPQTAWLFSSGEAIDMLRRRMPDHDWASAVALTTHPRIAMVAKHLGFGTVLSCRPGLPDVLAALESHWSHIQ